MQLSAGNQQLKFPAKFVLLLCILCIYVVFVAIERKTQNL